MGIFVVTLLISVLFPFFWQFVGVVCMCACTGEGTYVHECCVYLCTSMLRAEVGKRIDPAKCKVPKSQVPGGVTSWRGPAPFRAPPPGDGLRTRSLISHGTSLPAPGRPGGRRLRERPRSQQGRERPVRDPAEVRGLGRFSRRRSRGRGPFGNYFLDNTLPKLPQGRSRLPCR